MVYVNGCMCRQVYPYSHMQRLVEDVRCSPLAPSTVFTEPYLKFTIDGGLAEHRAPKIPSSLPSNA